MNLQSPLSCPRRRSRIPAPPEPRSELSWIHDGTRYRVTLFPEVAFEREHAPGQWLAGELDEMAFASAALGVTAQQWRRYLEFAPGEARVFLERFEFGRMAALQVITRCPGLLGELQGLPTLTPFLAAHVSLRGGDEPRWGEIAAVHERDGLFGLLQWLGLPASRQTVAILRHICDPDIPRRLLEPLRAALWEPTAIWSLSHAAPLTDERLAEACHALAA